MRKSFKSIAARGLYLLLGIVLLLASGLVFKATFSGKTARSYQQRKTEKSFFYAGIVLAIASLGSFSLGLVKEEEGKKKRKLLNYPAQNEGVSGCSRET